MTSTLRLACRHVKHYRHCRANQVLSFEPALVAQRWVSSPSIGLPNDPPAKPTKSLANVLADSIRASGPVSVSVYMRTCLLDPQQGYYASANATSTQAEAQRTTDTGRDVLGARGDFITSPEISQVFGELLAIFFIARWQTVMPTAPVRLVELGPGKGTLLADMIRTFARFKTFFAKLTSIHLVETSPGLIMLQHDALKDALALAGKRIAPADQEVLAEDEVRVEWFPGIEVVPVQSDTWTMLVAHEFFDALPTHIFEKHSDGSFREVLVDVDRPKQGGVTVLRPNDLIGNTAGPSKTPGNQDAKFRFVLSPSATPWSMLLASRTPRFQTLQPGQRVEISPEAWAAARKVGELVSGRAGKQGQPDEEKDEARTARERREAERQKGVSQGGAGIIIDYGDEKAFGNSFRAFKAHQIVDPLEAPGKADLTCNVDFAYLKTALHSTDAKALGTMYQAHFLKALGLDQRLEALLANAASEDRRKDITSSANRLIDANGMGAQYKVLGIDASPSADGQRESRKPCYPFEMSEEV